LELQRWTCLVEQLVRHKPETAFDSVDATLPGKQALGGMPGSGY
jgi:hypothetical protein